MRAPLASSAGSVTMSRSCFKPSLGMSVMRRPLSDHARRILPLHDPLDDADQELRRAAETVRAEGGDLRGEVVVVARLAAVGEREQYEHLHLRLAQLAHAGDQLGGVAALVEVGD